MDEDLLFLPGMLKPVKALPQLYVLVGRGRLMAVWIAQASPARGLPENSIDAGIVTTLHARRPHHEYDSAQ